MPVYKPQQNVFQPATATPPPPPSVPPPTTDVSASGTALGSSPFGSMRIPDFSSATPQQIREITEGLGNLTYSIPLGGYITRAESNDPTSAYVRGYYGHPMIGGDPSANALARRIYSMIGDFPTTAGGTGALNALYQQQGIARPQHESLNEILRGQGYYRGYGGPWEYPGYNPAKDIARSKGLVI